MKKRKKNERERKYKRLIGSLKDRIMSVNDEATRSLMLIQIFNLIDAYEKSKEG